MHIKIKNTLLISITILVTFTKLAVACEKLPIAELQYMEKNELIKTGCFNELNVNKYHAKSIENHTKAEEKKAIGDTGSYNLFIGWYYADLNTAICSEKNAKTILNVLRKDHKIKTKGFYKKNCKSN